MVEKAILEVRGLKTHFATEEGLVRAVDGVDFTLRKGETLAIVGESGCGKSVTSLSILRILQSPPGKIVAGEIFFAGQDLTKISEREMRRIRGNDISMIFQEPLTSLNPVFTIGYQIMDTIRMHQKVNRKEARKRAIHMLSKVGIPSPEKVLTDYPHQLSGGMRQRAMIAMALACNPKVLIADEPTTALDVTIQAQILELIKDIRDKTDTAIVLITHDLGVVAQIAESVLVMYAGQVVEYAHVHTIFEAPKHPYTVGLLNSIPVLGQMRERLYSIQGTVPSTIDNPPGCRFAKRCPDCFALCLKENPEIFQLGEGHTVRCWKYAVQGEKEND